MKRTTEARIGKIIQFDNDNINVKFDPMGVYRRESDLINLLWLLDEIDVDFIGEEFCLSNYDMGLTLYSYYSDKCYTLSYSELSDCFNNNKTLKLYAHEPDEWEREDIQKRMGE